jgi:hypothetical protein
MASDPHPPSCRAVLAVRPLIHGAHALSRDATWDAAGVARPRLRLGAVLVEGPYPPPRVAALNRASQARSVPSQFSKKDSAGETERIALLERGGVPANFVQDHLARNGSHRDDFLDACAGAWTAWRIVKKQAERFPETSVTDARGLDMAMWF